MTKVTRCSQLVKWNNWLNPSIFFVKTTAVLQIRCLAPAYELRFKSIPGSFAVFNTFQNTLLNVLNLMVPKGKLCQMSYANSEAPNQPATESYAIC